MRGDTIVALCTAQGKAALSVLRLSGPKALAMARPIAPFLPKKPSSHRLYYGILKHKKQELDQVLISYFAKGQSFTGEESLEISCHGGEIYSDILKALIEQGARPAKKGEFSLQAFSNGKMDLIQAEALLQLIEGENPLARKQALFQLQGRLSESFLKLEKKWLYLLSHIEADIDFSLEGLKSLSEKEIQSQLKDLKKELEELISRYKPFESLQNGLSVGLFGPSNVGKSSLFNKLLQEEKAIVSKEEGTTRDIVEARMPNPKGLNLLLKDSAGFRESLSQGEKKGQEKALQLFKSCDYRLLLVDSCKLILKESLFEEKHENTWLVWTKSDLLGAKAKAPTPKEQKQKLLKALKQKYKNLKFPDKSFLISSVSGEGISQLRQSLLSCGILNSEEALISNSRHFKALLKMKESLINSQKLAERDIMALELRQGLLALYEILGKHIEDRILDQIFKQFCIGK